ncbi:MAG: hypothetical protein OEY03_01640 [Rhizobacter sp.]|nr:hypothetical protein [Rhizobacter sp.]
MTRIARLAAASTALAITLAIFHAVVSLAEPPKSSTAMQLAAKAPVVVALTGQSVKR